MKISGIKASIGLFVVVSMISLSAHATPKHAKNKGYPNGRGWQAVQRDLNIIKMVVRRIDSKTDQTLYTINQVDAKIDAIQNDLLNLSDDVADLKNVLDIQVSVELDAAASTPAPGVVRVIARIIVQVNQLGSGLDTLSDISFVYSNSYGPTGGATSYCGLSCFSALGNGLYVLEITDQDYVPGTYAATLIVQDQSKPQPNPVGTTLVTFTLP